MKRLLPVSEETARIILRRLDIIMASAAILAVSSLIAEHGFYLPDEIDSVLRYVDLGIVGIFIIHRASKAILDERPLLYIRRHVIDFALIGFIVTSVLITTFLEDDLLQPFMEEFAITDVTRIYIALAQVYILLTLLTTGVRYSKRLATLKLRPALVLVLSFLLVIVVGTCLLLLPRATTDQSISFVNALFTATSATCVTGLIVVDTGVYFTTFGQIIILLLMQIGGLGIMTSTTFFAIFLGGGLGIKERLLMRDFLSEESLGAVGRTVRRLILFSLATEAVGIALLYISWGEELFATNIERLYYSVFHGVAAFCHSGFSLFSESIADPSVLATPSVSLWIAILILIGGLGYPALNNIGNYLSHTFSRDKSGRIERLNVHTRLVLLTSAVLIIAGVAGVVFSEWNGVLAPFAFWEKLYHGLFLSITTRSAGFNTVDTGSLTTATALLCIILMFIGASPGSTGGGIKTTTFSVGLMTILSLSSGKNRVEVFGRQVSQPSILRAYVSIMLAIGLAMGTTVLLTLTDDAPLLDLIFDAVSAASTTGLSRGVTPHLSDPGKLIITAAMFIGRIGAFTLALALIPQRDDGTYNYPQENVITI
jgi:trk system potassium uptake protein TrkH